MRIKSVYFSWVTSVFEVICPPQHPHCYIVGYFTHPKLSPGYNGLVVHLHKISDEGNYNKKQPQLVIKTYRNGTPRVETPLGYWYAMMEAEKVLLGIKQPKPMFIDAITGRQVPSPDMECLDLSKSNKKQMK